MPCYRSGEWLPELTSRLSAVLDDAVDGSFEIVLVNDGSGDATYATIASLAAADGRIFGIDLLRNVGQFRALVAAMDAASGEIIVTMDDDLQHPPEEIPKLLAALDADPDLDAVVGRYGSGKKHSRVRNVGSRLMDLIFRSSYGKPADLAMTSLRAMRRNVAEGMVSFGTARPVPNALLLQTTSRIANVEVEHQARPYGSSGQPFMRLVNSVFDNLINASTTPLRFISGLGLVTSFAALCLLVFYLLRSLTGAIDAPGFATIVLLIIFFGGAILLAIGVLGEYVSRLVSESVAAPRYLVRATTRDRDARMERG